MNLGFRLSWHKEDLKYIKLAAKQVDRGASVYSQVYFLHSGLLRHRSWDAIRKQINKFRKVKTKGG